VNLAGVEIIIKMRRRMIDMQKQIEDLVTYVRDEGGQPSRRRDGDEPRAALVRAASGQLGPVDLSDFDGGLGRPQAPTLRAPA
jgi:hypothetical protein